MTHAADDALIVDAETARRPSWRLVAAVAYPAETEATVAEGPLDTAPQQGPEADLGVTPTAQPGEKRASRDDTA